MNDAYDRTPEQRQADHDLEEAIRASAHAYGEEGLLMEWVVVAAHHISGDDGATYTACNYVTSDDLPAYRLMGLLEFTKDEVRANIRSQD